MTTAIVFDLDGTLVDSLADIAAAVNRMLDGLGRAALPEATIKTFVGNGLPKLVERVMTHCDIAQDQHTALTRITFGHYNSASIEQTRPYPGVVQALERLQLEGSPLGVCTNKPESPARHILDALDMTRFFDVVIGGDTLSTRKPDPAPLHTAFQALGQNTLHLFVGDSEVDAATAKRAQVPFLMFSEGYRKSPLAQIPHTASFDSFAALPDLVRNIQTANKA